jgi:hypothetical protein
VPFPLFPLDPPPFPLAAPAPDAPLFAVVEGVGETLVYYRAATGVVRVGSQAYRLGLLHLAVVLVICEEEIRSRAQALGVGEPIRSFSLGHRR